MGARRLSMRGRARPVQPLVVRRNAGARFGPAETPDTVTVAWKCHGSYRNRGPAVQIAVTPLTAVSQRRLRLPWGARSLGRECWAAAESRPPGACAGWT